MIYEAYIPREPLIRIEVFKGRSNSTSFAGTLLHGMILWCLLYYAPLYYEAVKGQSPVIAGVSLLPDTFTVAPAAGCTGVLVAVTGKYRPAIWTGWALSVLGAGLFYLMDVHTSVVQYVFLNLPYGIGMGILFPATSFPIMAANLEKDQAFAVSMYTFVRSFGQAIGVAIGGVIFQNQMRKKLLAYPLLADRAGAYSQDAAGLVRILKNMPDDLAKLQLRQAYADSLKVVWLVLCGLCAAALFLSFFIEEISLDRELETEQGFRDHIKKIEEIPMDHEMAIEQGVVGTPRNSHEEETRSNHSSSREHPPLPASPLH